MPAYCVGEARVNVRGAARCKKEVNSAAYQLLGTKVVVYAGFSGFQRKIGLRAAAVSSMRETRVECGALSTV